MGTDAFPNMKYLEYLDISIQNVKQKKNCNSIDPDFYLYKNLLKFQMNTLEMLEVKQYHLLSTYVLLQVLYKNYSI